jgi:TRAP-type mannitol/chloroaromatic compound transport system permease small subunit
MRINFGVVRDTLLHIINTTNEKIGSYIGLLLIAMTIMMTYEVVGRRLFNSPTSWAWPMCVQCQVILAALAGGYCVLHEAHVRMDVIYSRLSRRLRAALDVATFAFVLIFLGVGLWTTLEAGLLSFSLKEYVLVGFKPPIWHLKLVVIPLGILLFLFQAVAKFVRNLQVLLEKRM